MTCREFIDFLMQYSDGELPASERSRFDDHLAECPSCEAYLKTYEATVKLGKWAFCHPDDPVPADIPEQLIQAILAARQKRD
jgi:anti-sigma factor RsiW